MPAGWGLGREPMVVAEADLQAMRQEWVRRTGRPPTPPELQASILRWAGDEAMFREALRRGLDRDDPVVNERLLRNLRFLDPQRAGDPAELLRAARALGMVRHDPVIRGRLVQRLEAALAGELRISAAELRAYVEAHPQRYAQPARQAFDNVFIATDGRGPDAEARAHGLARRLRAGEAAAAGEGDAFPLPTADAALSQDELERRLGPAVAAALAAAAPGEWVGPVASPFGWHLLRVTRRVPAADPDLAAVREPAARALHAERRQQQRQAARARLLERYRLQLPPGVVLDPGASS